MSVWLPRGEIPSPFRGEFKRLRESGRSLGPNTKNFGEEGEGQRKEGQREGAERGDKKGHRQGAECPPLHVIQKKKKKKGTYINKYISI